jgi:hypothetical protein
VRAFGHGDREGEDEGGARAFFFLASGFPLRSDGDVERFTKGLFTFCGGMKKLVDSELTWIHKPH